MNLNTKYENQLDINFSNLEDSDCNSERQYMIILQKRDHLHILHLQFI